MVEERWRQRDSEWPESFEKRHRFGSDRVFKLIAGDFIDVLVKLLNFSILEGVFPNNLKIAQVTSLPKEGDLFEPSNNGHFFSSQI